MTMRNPIGFREYPCPDDSVSLEEAIRQQLDEMDETTTRAFIDFCDDRIDDFLELEARRRREHADEIHREMAA